jgi:hypothetical protein
LSAKHRRQHNQWIKKEASMKAISFLSVLFLLGFAAGCSTIYSVDYDYDKHIQFSDLKQFDWIAAPENKNVSPFVVEQIKAAVDGGLQAKGLTRTTHNPDFMIAQHIGKKEKVDVENYGYLYGHSGVYVGGAFYGPVDGVSTYEYEEGTLILDFVHPESKHLIWRGSAKTEIHNQTTAEEREKVIGEAVAKILENFPPPPK